MKSVLVLLFMVSFLLGLAACSEKKEETGQQQPDAKSAFVLAKQEVGKSLQIPSELLPYEKAEIHAKIEAFVQRVQVDIGDRVRAGQVLAVLSAPEASSRFSEASAQVQQYNARYQASLDRYQRLREASREPGVIAESELIGARNQMLADSAAIQSARSSTQAYGQLRDYLTIRAPFSGVITSRSVNQGDLVGTGTQSMFTLETPAKLRLRVHVPEAYIGGISSAHTLTFTTDAMVGKSYEATLSRKSGSIDPTTRTELWEYEYVNKNGELKPGMYTLAELRVSRAAPSFVVPFPAVATSQEKRFVVRIRNGKSQWVDVRQGISLSAGVEVFGELTEGDTLLSRATDEIKPETTVNVTIQKP